MLKRYRHNPVHLLLDDTPYFITAAIHEKRPLLGAHEIKVLVRDTMQAVFEQYGWQLLHWVIVDNHYHLFAQSRQGKMLSRVMHDIHFLTAAEIHKTTHCEKPVWWNYWDYCPRNQKDALIRQNYLLYNPVKHGYVTDLRAYPYSSFHEAFERRGREQLAEQFTSYPEYKTLRLTEAYDDDF